jgi:hypothetical protein
MPISEKAEDANNVHLRIIVASITQTMIQIVMLSLAEKNFAERAGL